MVYKPIYRRLIHQRFRLMPNSVYQYRNYKCAGIYVYGIAARETFLLPDIFLRYYLARKARQSVAKGACCSLEETENRVPLSEVSFRTDGSRRCRTDFIRPRGVAGSSFGCLRHGAVTGQRSLKTLF